jgi:hypothetical protein
MGSFRFKMTLHVYCPRLRGRKRQSGRPDAEQRQKPPIAAKGKTVGKGPIARKRCPMPLRSSVLMCKPKSMGCAAWSSSIAVCPGGLQGCTKPMLLRGSQAMDDYILLFRGRNRSLSPEQMQRTMEKWLAWFEGLRKSGHLKDGGHPLADARKIVTGKQRSVNDGPFVEAKDLVNGYIVVMADDLEHATELAKGCPTLDGDGSVEVRPIEKMAP